jgi:hypothetical protein
MLTHRTAPGAWILAVAAGAVLCCAAIPLWGAAAVTAFTLWTALTPERLLMGDVALGAGEAWSDAAAEPPPGEPGGLADRELGPA